MYIVGDYEDHTDVSKALMYSYGYDWVGVDMELEGTLMDGTPVDVTQLWYHEDSTSALHCIVDKAASILSELQDTSDPINYEDDTLVRIENLIKELKEAL